MLSKHGKESLKRIVKMADTLIDEREKYEAEVTDRNLRARGFHC